MMLAETEEFENTYRGLNPAFVQRVWERRRVDASVERALLPDMPQRIRDIVRAGCRKHNVDLSLIMSPSRKRSIVPCRDEIQYRIRSMSGKRPSYPQIARWLHRKAHTDVLHAVARHAARTGEPNLTSCDYETRMERVRGQARIAMRKLRANRTTGKDTHS